MRTKKWLPILLVVALVGCSEEEGRRVPLGEDTAQSDQRREAWPEGLAVLVDSANAAYAAERYEEAAEIYRDLAEEHANIGTVWFGLYMAEKAVGNEDAAVTALERAESINPGLGMMHDAAESSGMGDMLREGGMPTDHPPLDSVPTGEAPIPDAAG